MLPCTDSFLTISQAFQPACMRGTTPEGTLSLSLGGRTQISVEQRLSFQQFLQLNIQWNGQVSANYDVECMRQAFQVPDHYVGLYMLTYIPQHNGQGQDHFPSHYSLGWEIQQFDFKKIPCSTQILVTRYYIELYGHHRKIMSCNMIKR